MITLYGRPLSRASRNLWALEELGLTYKNVPYDQNKSDIRSPEYLALNPAGKIPLLVDESVAMSESLAINLYLAQTYGVNSLWPIEIGSRCKCLQWTLWAATELEPPVEGLLFEFMKKKEPDRDVVLIKTLAERARPLLNLLNEALGTSRYLAGPTFSVADLNVSAVTEYLVLCNFDLSGWPALSTWLAQCLERPAHQKVAAMRRMA